MYKMLLPSGEQYLILRKIEEKNKNQIYLTILFFKEGSFNFLELLKESLTKTVCSVVRFQKFIAKYAFCYYNRISCLTHEISCSFVHLFI